MSQGQRVLSAMQSGASMTAKQIAARFRVANPTAVITRLRSAGNSIVTTQRTNSKGETRSFYSLANS